MLNIDICIVHTRGLEGVPATDPECEEETNMSHCTTWEAVVSEDMRALTPFSKPPISNLSRGDTPGITSVSNGSGISSPLSLELS